MVSEITSLHHPLVKKCVGLRTDKEVRDHSKTVFLIGEKMVRELSQVVEIQTLITKDPSTIKAQERYVVTEAVLKKMTGLPAPDGFAAIAPLPEPQVLKNFSRLLILDRIQDPGNLGTLLRTAFALNWDGVVFTPGTVDPFNDKALRASKGALFSLPYSYELPNVKPLYIYLADLDGTPLAKTKFQTPLALVLSNEGAGPDARFEKEAQKISIPMHNRVESLNVAMSGAILLYGIQ